jgi:hypothetical protein
LDACAGTKEYGPHFNFILICCDGPDLAKAFANRLKLTHVTNTVSLDQPKFGQLGCSGFIVLDQFGRVKCEKTMAFLQHREAAFEQMTALMDAMLNDADDSVFQAALAGRAAPGAANAEGG